MTARRYQVASRRDPHGLTRREREIATQLYEGLTVREVSVALAMQYETVRTHIKNIRRKLGVRSLLGIVAAMRKQAELERLGRLSEPFSEDDHAWELDVRTLAE